MQVSTPMGTGILHLGEVPPSGTPSHREPLLSLFSPDTGYPPLNLIIYLDLLPGLPGKPARPQPDRSHTHARPSPQGLGTQTGGVRGPTLGPLLLKLKSSPNSQQHGPPPSLLPHQVGGGQVQKSRSSEHAVSPASPQPRKGKRDRSYEATIQLRKDEWVQGQPRH